MASYIEQELFPVGYLRLEAEKQLDGTWRVAWFKGERWRLVGDLEGHVCDGLSSDEALDVIAANLDALKLDG